MNVQHALVPRCAAALGALLGAAVSPAYGATIGLPALNLSLGPSDYVLGMLLVGLIVALIVSLARGHRDVAPQSDGPDMRWWKSSHTDEFHTV